MFSVKCRKCRNLLFTHPEVTVLTAHGDSCSNFSVKYIDCKTIQEDNVYFLQDSNIPDWISNAVNEVVEWCCFNFFLEKNKYKTLNFFFRQTGQKVK